MRALGAVECDMDKDDRIMRDIKTIQTLGSIAIIASPVSLVFGGVLLSLVALVCALVGRSKLKVLGATDEASQEVLDALGRQMKVALIVSIATLVINGIFSAFMFSYLMQAMQSGDLSQLGQMMGFDPNSLGGSGEPDAAPEGSLWDK